MLLMLGGHGPFNPPGGGPLGGGPIRVEPPLPRNESDDRTFTNATDPDSWTRVYYAQTVQDDPLGAVTVVVLPWWKQRAVFMFSKREVDAMLENNANIAQVLSHSFSQRGTDGLDAGMIGEIASALVQLGIDVNRDAEGRLELQLNDTINTAGVHHIPTALSGASCKVWMLSLPGH